MVENLEEFVLSLGNHFQLTYDVQTQIDGTVVANASINGPSAVAFDEAEAKNTATKFFFEKLKESSFYRGSEERSDIADSPQRNEPFDSISSQLRNLNISNWFQSHEFCNLIQDFQNQKASYPKEEIDLAQPTLDNFLVRLLVDEEMDLLEYEYQGSVYEFLKINSTPLEFDVMLIQNWDSKDYVKIDTEYPGFARFRAKNIDSSQSKLSNTDGFLRTESLITKFYGRLHRFLNRNPNDLVKLSRHGCALKLVMSNGGNFEVDVVPGLKFENELFVCRNHSDADWEKTSWRKSTSKEEVEKLRHIDDDGGCRRNIVRILKALKDSTKNKGQLATLSTYILKTAMLHIGEDNIDWQPCNIHNCFIHTLQILKNMLLKRNISNYFIPQQNLLKSSKYSDEVIQTCVNYMERLISSEERMKRVLSTHIHGML